MTKLTKTEFNNLVKAAGLKDTTSRAAAKRVLVDGLSLGEASREAEIDKGGLSRYLSKFPTGICECCGQPTYNKSG